ncbi:DUF916 and DUF3324 domain-containing protein [Candidatus Enterococcus murrayae]|uniref:DUF916 and DUF3324 domain-containing protein n=1 Tax=Candidatus Enterococcus murrayae TaxID=2815321 RepID=A0ABS3HLE6_9ENTE|nr:DUF916 and DUF3324 domain-containing protein [Enterococcus sp. MJM16]MBO0454270.1 DUF916 and DUF3324 domain-containing protein [Enterococcus sp. MJM16]
MLNPLTKKKAKFLFIGLFCFLLSPMVTQAEGAQESPGFTVESVVSEKQVDPNQSYFYLSVEPNTLQTIQVKVRSIQEEPVTVSLAIHDAVSSSIGSIDYTQKKPELDESLKDPITKIVTIKEDPKEVTVANFEEKIIEYQIKPPEENFPGIKLGALRFVRKDTGKAQTGGLKTEYAYVIALMLTEDGEDFNRGADLTLKSVGMKRSKGKNVVAAKIQNHQPKMLQEAGIMGNIKRKGEKKVLNKFEIKEFSAAPNSNFEFNVPLDKKNLSAGTYVFTGIVKSDDQTWRWKKEFNVAREKDRKLDSNKQARTPKWQEQFPMVVGLILLALGVLPISIKQKQRQIK